MTGMMQDHHFLQLSHLEHLFAELLCHREEVLSGMRISFLKASVSPSSLGVFL